MVSLIIGHKGTGKTKHLIAEVNKAVENSKGNVVCIEKGQKLTYDINSQARLVSADDFAVNGYDTYYGFIAGMCASNSDITDVLADGTLKIGGEIGEELVEFFERIRRLSDVTNIKFVFTLSADESELPKELFYSCQKI